MPITSEADNEYLAWRNQLFEELHLIATHWKIWLRLNEHAIENPNVLNQSSSFWDLTRVTHLKSVLLGAARLTDQHSKSASIPRFLNFVINHKELFEVDLVVERQRAMGIQEEIIQSDLNDLPDLQQVVRDCKDRMKGIRPTLTSLRLRRNKIWAHTDMAIVENRKGVSSVFRGSVDDLPDAPLTRREIDSCVDVLCGVVNSINGAYERSDRLFPIVGAESGLDHLIRTLAAQLESE